MALNGGDRRQRAHLPQALDRAERQIEPRRIEPVDDIEVVIAGKNEHAFDERRMLLHRIEKLRPLGCDTGVSHVAGDKDQVERAIGMNGFETRKDARETLIAARPAPPALDAKSIAIADEMNVRQMRDAPAWTARRGVVVVDIDRLRH